ncbi:hypothetical protein FKM82_002610 [Ascaphus truei]
MQNKICTRFIQVKNVTACHLFTSINLGLFIVSMCPFVSEMDVVRGAPTLLIKGFFFVVMWDLGYVTGGAIPTCLKKIPPSSTHKM